MARIAVLHHLDEPFLGHAEVPLRASGVELDERDLRGGDPLPDLGEVDGIISFGGDQSVLEIERYPYMQAEAELMREAARRDIPQLGVCLGGQLLAHALGGRVMRMPMRVVEWAEVRRLPEAEGDPVIGALPPVVRALHWNEDGFEPPPAAAELLTRACNGAEAFRLGRAWGIQFHPEPDGAALDGWYALSPDWLAEAGVAEAAAREADRLHLAGQAATADAVFGGFASLVAAPTPLRSR
jgi:GMP synthase (glutamine-hydrolysing)